MCVCLCVCVSALGDECSNIRKPCSKKLCCMCIWCRPLLVDKKKRETRE